MRKELWIMDQDKEIVVQIDNSEENKKAIKTVKQYHCGVDCGFCMWYDKFLLGSYDTLKECEEVYFLLNETVLNAEDTLDYVLFEMPGFSDSDDEMGWHRGNVE